MTAQIVLNEKQSTYGGPYGYYTVTLTPSNRTANSVTVKCDVSAHLQKVGSYTGWGVTVGLYIGGQWHDFTLTGRGNLEEGTAWAGTDPIYASTTINVAGLSDIQTTITGIQFRAVDGYDGVSGPGLDATNCSNLTIDYYTAPEQPFAPALADTSRVAIPYIYISGSWT